MSWNPESTVVVLHDLGDPAGGRTWQTALAQAGWPGLVVAPDLPGHAGVPPPVGGFHELADPAFTFASLALPSPVDLVVGVGASGWAAQLVTLGGRARAVALVDGLGSPWLDRRTRLEASRDRLRALARLGATAAVVDPQGLDPALHDPPRPHGDRDLARRALSSLDAPLLVIERRSPPAPDDVDDLLASRTGRTQLVSLPGGAPAEAAAEIVMWSASLRS